MTKKPILELLAGRYRNEHHLVRAAEDRLMLRLVLALELHCEQQAEVLELERARQDRAAKMDAVINEMSETSAALGKSLVRSGSTPPVQPQSLVALDFFGDVLAPALNMVTALSDKQQLGRLFDMAIVFGAIQAREGTGGFDALTAEALRGIYDDKRVLGDEPPQ